MTDQRVASGAFAASTGLAMTESTFLDAHFETNRVEFEEVVRAVGIEAGWHVLDVGCGSGEFLPLLAARVGESGRLSAIDLAPDNIAVVQAKIARWDLPCAVEARVGSALALPYADNSLDAVWCANVLMYLTDAELDRGLSELRRVVRPGGAAIAKETDGALCIFYPIAMDDFAPALMSRTSVVGSQRSRGLWARFQGAGIDVLSQRMVMIERHAPLRPVERRFIGDALVNDAIEVERLDMAGRVDLSADTRAFWRAQRDPASPDCILNRPDFTWCEGISVVVGRVP